MLVIYWNSELVLCHKGSKEKDSKAKDTKAKDTKVKDTKAKDSQVKDSAVDAGNELVFSHIVSRMNLRKLPN